MVGGRIAVLLAGWFMAALIPVHGQEDAELEALLSILEEETEIATRTRMNSDFVPGIVTVLDGEKLEALGARTVWDAMPYVPGVQALLDGAGSPSVTVRGIPFPFNSGSIQVLVDGIPIGRESAGINGSALFIPVEQVDRLEFIRGPGSVIYGDFAFQGLLNIITRKDQRRAAVHVDDRDSIGGDAQYAAASEAWRWNVNAAVHDTDEALLPVAADGQEQRGTLFAGLSHSGFAARVSLIEREVDGDARPFDESSWSVSLSHDHALRDALQGRVQGRYLSNDIASGTNRFDGTELELGYQLFWDGWSRQRWLAGVEYQSADIDRGVFVLRPPPGANPPGGGPPPATRRVDFSGDDRDVVSLYLQNQIELNPDLRLTLGARYDDVDVIGDRVTPRVSLVWQLAERHILKAQYAEGFRTPTFFELFDPDTPADLDFEVNQTTELVYIYREPNRVFRASAFHSRIEDMVFVDFANRGFNNLAEAGAEGIELEWTQQVGSGLQLDANVAWVDSEDDRNPQGATVDIPAVPNWMANLGLLWSPSEHWLLGLHWNHVDERESARPGSGEYDQVDLTVTRRHLWPGGPDLRLGIINALDEEIVHVLDGPVQDFSFSYDTRTVWAQLRWTWSE